MNLKKEKLERMTKRNKKKKKWHIPTVILFWVRVPVLSEQMVEVDPKVSTDSKFLTKTFFLAIFLEVKVKATLVAKKIKVNNRTKVIH